MSDNEQITLDQWQETYLHPFTDDALLQNAIDEYGGFAGWVYEGVSALSNVDGEWATDHECLEIIALLIKEYLALYPPWWALSLA